MFSINIDSNIIKEVRLIDINIIKAHEKVINNRKNAFVDYLKSLEYEIIISSIIVCNKTNMIVDGHHRYWALKELGYSTIPVTFISYLNKNIRPHIDNRISKDFIINSSISGNLLSPKSSRHQVLDLNSNIWKPIILISSLFTLKTKK
tara:strand:+ start:682 stop:1125 length:444 start_codon:yes stop_codon:yes gene_type:complete